MSSDDGELGSSGCISPIIKAAAFSSLTPFPLSLFTLPPFLSVHLLKFPLFQDLFFSTLFFFSTPPCPLTTFMLLRFLSPPLPPAATARPRLWFKHDGHPFEAWGHRHHHRSHQQQAAPWTNLANTEREMHWRPPPIHPPQP